MITASAQHELSEPRPLAGSQLKPAGGKRMAASIGFELHRSQVERPKHMLLDIRDWRALQFASQQFHKNLEMARSVSEFGSRFRHGRQANRGGIAIGD